MPIDEGLRVLAREFRGAFDAFERSASDLAPVVEAVVSAIRSGRRVHLFGAGTSGRLAALDAAEIPPTFGMDPELFEAHLAGGPAALTTAVEDVEDDVLEGAQAAEGVQAGDVAIGLTASGRTPYVLAALEVAKERSAYTVQIDCTRSTDSPADCHVTLQTGAEAIAGSTRLNAATAQKLALNAISTLAMVHLGRTYSNLMVCVQPNNSKLRGRLARILMDISGASEAAVVAALEDAGHDGRVAVVMLTRGWTRSEAVEALAAAETLRSIIEGPGEQSGATAHPSDAS